MTYHRQLFADAAPVGTLKLEGESARLVLGATPDATLGLARPLGVIVASLLAALLLARDL